MQQSEEKVLDLLCDCEPPVSSIYRQDRQNQFSRTASEDRINQQSVRFSQQEPGSLTLPPAITISRPPDEEQLLTEIWWNEIHEEIKAHEELEKTIKSLLLRAAAEPVFEEAADKQANGGIEALSMKDDQEWIAQQLELPGAAARETVIKEIKGAKQ